MKQITDEEAKTLVLVLRSNWVPMEYQQIIYNLLRRLERELES